MARHLRVEYPYVLYHVTSRGDPQEAIFNDDRARTAILKVKQLSPECLVLAENYPSVV
jgi:hypothetical protein